MGASEVVTTRQLIASQGPVVIPAQNRNERVAQANENHALESKIEERHWALLTISFGAETVSPIHRHRVFSLMHSPSWTDLGAHYFGTHV